MPHIYYKSKYITGLVPGRGVRSNRDCAASLADRFDVRQRQSQEIRQREYYRQRRRQVEQGGDVRQRRRQNIQVGELMSGRGDVRRSR